MTNASPGLSVVSSIRPMGYEDARELVQSGDLVAVRGRKRGLNALISLVTRSPYTHTGIALWMEGRLLLVETRGVAALVPLSQYADNDFDVVRCPLSSQAGKWNVQEAVFSVLGATIKYDFADLYRIAMHELFGAALPAKEDRRMVCSSLSAAIYLAAGWRTLALPSIPTPRDVVAAAGPVAIQVRVNPSHG